MSDDGFAGMPLLAHLEEFRKRIFRAVIALVVGAIVAYFFSGRIIGFLTWPVDHLIFLSPPEAFVTHLKVALITGLALGSPYIIYQLWRFVRPALMKREARYIIFAVIFSTLFFLGGLAFALFVIMPIGIKFLLSFENARLSAEMSIDRYVTFVSHILFTSGLVFQLPVVLFFLTKLHIVNPRMLRKGRRVAIVLIVVAAALLTPPDVFTQLLMVIPLLGLYELGILGSALAARGRRDRPQ